MNGPVPPHDSSIAAGKDALHYVQQAGCFCHAYTATHERVGLPGRPPGVRVGLHLLRRG